MSEVVVCTSAEEAGELAAGVLAAAVARRADAVLGLATGSSPLPAYAALARRTLDLRRVRAFALDEYVGLPPGHPQSYRAVLARAAVVPLGLDPARVRVPGEGRVETAGDDYEAELTAVGGVEVQLLGIGRTGHIGFNEPGSSFASPTRVKTLTEQTRRDNARFFASPDEVPLHCVTQGLGTILRARHLLLLASGTAKAAAVAAAVEGPVTSALPASAIQLHPHVTVLLDEAAAGELTHLDYYRHAWANKPAWQGL